MSTNKVRLYVLTGAVAAITATGAWYGAGLNIRREVQQQKQVVLQASTAEKIEQMKLMRARLVRQRDDMQAKINKLNSTKSGDQAIPGPQLGSDKSSKSG